MTNKSRPHCPAYPDKRCYSSQMNAESYARKIQQKPNAPKELQAYYCVTCKYWHLTSHPEKEPDVILLTPFRCHQCGKVPATDWLYTSEKELLCGECATVAYLCLEESAVEIYPALDSPPGDG